MKDPQSVQEFLREFFLKHIAYLAGNVAMALGDDKLLYTWDSATMQVITISLS